MIFVTAYGIGQIVICDIHEKEKIVTADRFLDHTFGFAGTKTRYADINDIGIALITLECDGILVFVLSFLSPLYQIVVYFFTELFAAFKRDESETSLWNGF